MFTRNLLVLLAAGAIGVVAPRPSSAAVDVWVNIGPPPPRVEVVPGPRPGWVWQPGYWDWGRNQHVWRKGVWVRERGGYAYQPHHWAERDGRWQLERGRWERRP